MFLDCAWQTAARAAPAGEELPPLRTLEELKMTLVERAAEWPKQSAESRAKLLRASLDEALPQHVVVVESGAVVARDRVLRST